jgi:hypothetical protein
MAEQPFQHILLPAVGGGPDFSSSIFFAARDFSWQVVAHDDATKRSLKFQLFSIATRSVIRNPG